MTSKNLQTHKNIKKCARFYYRAHFLEGVNTLDATSSASTLPEQKEKSLEGVDTLDATLLRSRNTVKSKKINFASPLLRSVPLIHERTLAKLSQG